MPRRGQWPGACLALAAGWVLAAAVGNAAAPGAPAHQRSATAPEATPEGAAFEDRVARVRAALAAARSALPAPGPCCAAYAQWYNFSNFSNFPNFPNFPNVRQ